jgi:hypothetical protein
MTITFGLEDVPAFGTADEHELKSKDAVLKDTCLRKLLLSIPQYILKPLKTLALILKIKIRHCKQKKRVMRIELT